MGLYQYKSANGTIKYLPGSTNMDSPISSSFGNSTNTANIADPFLKIGSPITVWTGANDKYSNKTYDGERTRYYIKQTSGASNWTEIYSYSDSTPRLEVYGFLGTVIPGLKSNYDNGTPAILTKTESYANWDYYSASLSLRNQGSQRNYKISRKFYQSNSKSAPLISSDSHASVISSFATKEIEIFPSGMLRELRNYASSVVGGAYYINNTYYINDGEKHDSTPVSSETCNGPKAIVTIEELSASGNVVSTIVVTCECSFGRISKRAVTPGNELFWRTNTYVNTYTIPKPVDPPIIPPIIGEL